MSQKTEHKLMKCVNRGGKSRIWVKVFKWVVDEGCPARGKPDVQACALCSALLRRHVLALENLTSRLGHAGQSPRCTFQLALFRPLRSRQVTVPTERGGALGNPTTKLILSRR
jgi:hypothetical protein